MDWWAQPVWLYSERGTSTALLAEPFNLVSNLAFLAAALAGLWVYRRLPYSRRSHDHLLLIGLVALVGLGGALFHTFADRWSELADMLPMLVFMLVYLVYAATRLADLPPGLAALVALVFALLTLAAATMSCGNLDALLQPAWARRHRRWRRPARRRAGSRRAPPSCSGSPATSRRRGPPCCVTSPPASEASRSGARRKTN